MLTAEQKQKLDAQNQKISDNMDRIKHRIAVFSGKGGVGKTMVSVNLAYALHFSNKAAGILDADITGPNVPKMLGLQGHPENINDLLQPQIKEGVRAISIASMMSDDQALIWRGPMRSKLINQFLGDVEWGYLDYLIADLPPGTGDEILTIAQQMKPDLAIVVTTPQEVALLDAGRAVNMAKEIDIPHIGLIENMSGLICPECSHTIDLFGSGGGRKLAKELDIPCFGVIPIDVEARRLSDQGKPYVLEKWQSEISVEFIKIADKINQLFESQS